MNYIMRVQELGSNEVKVVEASGNISTIIEQLGLLQIHVIQYVEADGEINVTKY